MTDPAGTKSGSDPSAQIKQIIDDRLRRQAAGENVDDAQIVAAHRDLMPELGQELARLRRIDAARVQALRPSRSKSESSHGEIPSQEASQLTASGMVDSTVLKDSRARPDRVGPYRILAPLGEGGFGIVYLAEQTEPVRRRVALKVIKPGMDSKAVLARFEAEKQALALMEHPNVAKVFDAGTTERGRPYFVMEHVSGVPITEHCDRHKLGIEARLSLFMQVCGAVQHAHQKGIIHRDIKPSNLLVEFKDGSAVPKVIDFGVAKAIEYRLTERTLFTEQGQLIGTPEYMSPEQAEMTAQDIDTRSDIYSLGVVLYELLTGTRPFESQSLRPASFDEIRRIIRLVEPPKPSTRIGSMATREAKDRPAVARGGDLRMLARRLRGDLDWITMKAIEKDRTRRYATAVELAEDVGRHLRNEPVLASPPSTVYRMSKFVQRHKGAVGAVATVVVVLLVGLATSMSMYLRAESARAGAETSKRAEVQQRRLAEAERDKATAAQQRANREAETAKRVSEFLVGLFELSDPNEARGRTITAREILEKGSKRIANELADQPLVQAALMHTIGQVYNQLALYEEARTLLEHALEIRRRELGSRHEEVAALLEGLGEAYESTSRYRSAEAAFAECLEIRRELFGEDHPFTGYTIGRLAAIKHLQGEMTSAETMCVRMAMVVMEWPGDVESLRRFAYHKLDEMEQLWASGDRAAAVQTMEQLAAPFEKYFPPQIFLSGATAFSRWCFERGYDDCAEMFWHKALAMRRELEGDESLEVATVLYELGRVLRSKGNSAAAEPRYQEALTVRRKLLGPQHAHTLAVVKEIAELYEERGEPEQAAAYRALLPQASAQTEPSQSED